MKTFKVYYRMTVVKTIEADDEDEAYDLAYDDPPYPDVDGGDADSADVDSVTVEEDND